MKEKLLQIAKQKIEEHYQDKFTYALPDWAMLTADPEILAIVTVHGKEGILATKERVNFEVDFKHKESIQFYVTYLNRKMNTSLTIMGYIVFFDKKVYLQKDTNYPKELTANELDEIKKYNHENKELEIFILKFNTAFETVEPDRADL